MRNLLSFATLIFLLISPHALSSNRARFQHIGTQHGLPNDTVWSTTQDKNGFLWFGTSEGLARYDGYSFNVYTQNPSDKHSISGNTIKALSPSTDGSLWIGTFENGLNHFDHELETFTSYKHLSGDPNSLSSNQILSIANSKPDEIWVGTAKGLNFLDTRNNKIIHFLHQPKNTESIPSNKIYSLLIDSTNRLWIGTDSGLAILDIKTGQVRRISFEPLKNTAIRSFHQDKFNNIWLGTYNGLIKYDFSNEFFVEFPDKINGNKILSITSDKTGDLWVATPENGIYKITENNKFRQFTNKKNATNSLNDNVILSAFKDSSENLWFGSFSTGLNRLDPTTLNFGIYDNSTISCISDNVIYSVVPENNKVLWIGSQSGLTRYDLDTGACENHKINPVNNSQYASNIVLSITKNHKDSLLIGTGFAIFNFNKNTHKFSAVSKHAPIGIGATVLKQTLQGEILFGTHKGLYIQNLSTNNFELINSKTTIGEEIKINTVDVTTGGKIIIGSNIGLLKFNFALNILEPLLINNKPTYSKEVSATFLDAEEILFFSGVGGSFYSVDLNSNRMTAHLKGNIESVPNQFHSIEKDHSGFFWISTRHGLLKHHPVSGSLTHYYYSDGLQGNNFAPNSSGIFPNGNLVFGGRNGLNLFDPGKIMKNNFKSKTAFSNFYLANSLIKTKTKHPNFTLERSITNSTQITLNHKESIFSIDISSLHFSDPQQNQYAYYLEGIDSEWNYGKLSENRRLTFTKLPPGEYLLKVKTSNSAGLWNEIPKTLKIIVLPPPWATPWAYALYLALFVTSVIAFISFRTRNLRRRTALLENTIKEKTYELKQEKQIVENLLHDKENEFANISHELRTPLTLILGPTTQLLKQATLSDRKEKLSLIYRNAYRLLHMVDNILHLERTRSKPNLEKLQISAEPILHSIIDSFASLAKQKNITLHETKIEECTLLMVPDSLERITTNLLSNALKFTNHGGDIYFSSSKNKSGEYVIKIQDSGIGIAPSEQKIIFNKFHRLLNNSIDPQPGSGIGLSLVKQLVKLHNGSIILQSKVGIGTTISVELPFSEQSHSINVSSNINNNIINLEIENFSLNSTTELISPSLNILSSRPHNAALQTILIIEDNIDMMKFISSILQPFYTCISAKNGEIGIQLALENIPDLILSDIMMPIKDGYEVCQAVKNDIKTCHIPVILLTAKADKESKMKGWSDKADEYLNKPFDADELLLRIDNLIAIRNLVRHNHSIELFNSPQQPVNNSSVLPLTKETIFIKKLQKLVSAQYSLIDLKISQLADGMNMSERQLSRKLKGSLDFTPTEYLNRYRLKQASILLNQGVPPGTVALEVGFSTHTYFGKCFKAQFGCTPSEYTTKAESI